MLSLPLVDVNFGYRKTQSPGGWDLSRTAIEGFLVFFEEDLSAIA